MTLTIHQVNLPKRVPYAVNGSYNFTSLNSECYFKSEHYEKIILQQNIFQEFYSSKILRQNLQH